MRLFLCFECFFTFFECFLAASYIPYLSFSMSRSRCSRNACDGVSFSCSSCCGGVPQTHYSCEAALLAISSVTLVLAAVASIVPCFPTHIAGLVSCWLFIVSSSLTSSGIILQFNFHLLATKTSVVKPASTNLYSPTATVASSPSLYSIKAKEYSLL